MDGLQELGQMIPAGVTGWGVAFLTAKLHVKGLYKRIEVLEGDNRDCLKRYDTLVTHFLEFKSKNGGI